MSCHKVREDDSDKVVFNKSADLLMRQNIRVNFKLLLGISNI